MGTLYTKLIGVLVGIARATDGNEHLITPELTAFVADAMVLGAYAEEEELNSWLQSALEVKRNLVPNCFLCDNPCGRTGDLDPAQLVRESSTVKEAKRTLFSLARRAAASGCTDSSFLLFDALYLLGMEMETTEYLLPVMEKLKNLWQPLKTLF